MNMPDNNSRLSLTDYHFKLTILLNCFLFLFHLLFRFYMAIQLLLIEKQGLFGEFHFREGPQRYTLFRVFIPVFLLIGFVLLCYKLFRRVSTERVRLFFHQIFLFDRTALSKYLLFLLLSFGILSLVPRFTLLIRNLDTQYGFMDIDA